MRNESRNHQTWGITLLKTDWAAIDELAKAKATNRHKIAADAIRNIIVAAQAESPTAQML